MNEQPEPEPDNPLFTEFNISETGEVGDGEGINIVADLADPAIPEFTLIRRWASEALTGNESLSIRIIDTDEMIELNRHFTNKVYATNVLSFPAINDLEGVRNVPEELNQELGSLGDIAICAPTVAREAAEQRKELDAHWAHMLIHGILHLRGFDHKHDTQAETMEAEEVRILAKLGFADPYVSPMEDFCAPYGKDQSGQEGGCEKDGAEI